MLFITKLLVLALTATATATPILRRDTTTVQSDISQKIVPQIQSLTQDVNSFPASGLAGALAIDNDIQSLVTVVNGATSDILHTGSFGILAGTAITANYQLLIPTLLDTLSTIAVQAESWKDIRGGSALILTDLQSLNTAFNDFSNALISAEPLLLQAGCIAIKIQIDGAFTTAIAAYSLQG